jgi:hypothetical protein
MDFKNISSSHTNFARQEISFSSKATICWFDSNFWPVNTKLTIKVIIYYVTSKAKVTLHNDNDR